jgi:carboxyl-terminal processing protease
LEDKKMIKKMIEKRLILFIILIFTVASAGILVGRWTISNVNAEAEGYEELKVFTEALSLVRKNYVEDVKPRDLVYGAIKGMLGSLDPHSGFMTPEQYKELQTETKGEFGGIGIQIGVKEGILTVIAPIEDTPAYKVGIKAGDKIIKINNELTRGMSLQDAVSKMRGAPSTSVKIAILREGWKETKDFTLTREIIKVKSVKSKLLEDNIGYKDKPVPGTDSDRSFFCDGETDAGKHGFAYTRPQKQSRRTSEQLCGCHKPLPA